MAGTDRRACSRLHHSIVLPVLEGYRPAFRSVVEIHAGRQSCDLPGAFGYFRKQRNGIPLLARPLNQPLDRLRAVQIAGFHDLLQPLVMLRRQTDRPNDSFHLCRLLWTAFVCSLFHRLTVLQIFSGVNSEFCVFSNLFARCPDVPRLKAKNHRSQGNKRNRYPTGTTGQLNVV
jgi:hypothetical protein